MEQTIFQEKFNPWDFTDEAWKQEILAWEKEFNDFYGTFYDLLLNKGAIRLRGKYEVIANLANYEELHRKINALNFWRNQRKKAQARESADLDKLAEGIKAEF